MYGRLEGFTHFRGGREIMDFVVIVPRQRRYLTLFAALSAAVIMLGADRPSSAQSIKIGKTIGEGTFGKVKLGVHMKTQEKVAIKVLEKERMRCF